MNFDCNLFFGEVCFFLKKYYNIRRLYFMRLFYKKGFRLEYQDSYLKN